MENLRDKLREKGPSPESKPPLKRSGVKRKAPKKKSESLLAGLDVNRKLLLGAIGTAAIASMVAMTYLSDLSEGILEGGQKVVVFVPVEAIPARRQIDETMIEERKVPKALLPEGALTKAEDIVGKVVLAPVVRGEVLHAQRLGTPSDATGITPKLRAEERGFLFVPEGANDIALVKPGDEVDLTATLQTANGWISTKVVQRARVLSVGNRFNASRTTTEDAGESSAYGDLITLAVPTDKVALLAALKQQGNLSLSLRAPGDTTVSPPEIPEKDLANAVLGRLAKPAKPAPPKPQIIYKEVPRPVVRPQPKPRPKPAENAVEVYVGTEKK